MRRRQGDDARRTELDSCAFTREAWAQLQGFIEAAPSSPSRERIRFLLSFCEATGLLASELVAARLQDLRLVDGRWALAVHGKGTRNRVAVPGQAVRALQAYLAARGLPPLEQAPGEAPLVASAEDPTAAVGYRALYASVKSWFQRAIRASSLPEAEREVGLRATPHWLRHTCFTRALERGASLAAAQRQAGHADPRTTMRYARIQLAHLHDEMDGVFS